MSKMIVTTAMGLVAVLTAAAQANAETYTQAGSQARTVIAMNSDTANVPDSGNRALSQDADTSAKSDTLVETFSKTASCVNGMNKLRKKVCRYTLAAPEGMMAVPGSISVDGYGYTPSETQISGNEIEFVITNRSIGKKTVTVSADFMYAPEEISRTVLTQLRGQSAQ